MGKLMRSRGKSSHINANATLNSPIVGTHQQSNMTNKTLQKD